MSEIKPCPFVVAGPWREDEEAEDGGDLWRAEIQVVGGHAFVATVYGDSPDEAQGRAELAIEAWTTRASDACASVQKERDELREMLGRLLNARALSSVRELVAGWNGEHRPDGPYIERHPSRLGARIETNCGRIYELDEIMQEARAFLARYEGGRQ